MAGARQRREDLGARPGRELGAERAGRLRARRGAAAAREARRGSRRRLGRPGARRRRCCARRSPAAPIAPFTCRATTSRRPTRSPPPTRSPRRSRTSSVDLVLTGLQSDDQGFAQVGVVLAETARHGPLDHHHGSAGRGLAVAREARARRRLVPVDRDAAAGGAHDSERHQPASLRDAQGHHGREEEGDSRGARPPPASAARSGSSRSTCRRNRSRRA